MIRPRPTAPALLICALSLSISPSTAALAGGTVSPLLDAGSSFKGPKMKSARMRHTNATLPDGRVILFGGVGPEFIPQATADIWDPLANRFTRVKMKFPHDSGALARLSDGRYLLAGGATPLGVPAYDTAQLFDPDTTKFASTKGRLTYRRHGAAAATLTTGDVLIAGGWYEDAAATYPETYRPGRGTFAATSRLNKPRAYPLVLPTNDGRAVVLGGMATRGGTFIEDVEEYDPVRNTFTVIATELIAGDPGWIVADSFDRVVEDQQLADGRYLCLASRPEGSISRQALFTYDPGARKFARFNTVPALPDFPALWLLQPVIDAVAGRAYVLGVLGDTDPAQVQLYVVDLVTGSLTAPYGVDKMPKRTYLGGAAVALLLDGRLLLTGGHSEGGARTNFSAIKSSRFWQPY